MREWVKGLVVPVAALLVLACALATSASGSTLPRRQTVESTGAVPDPGAVPWNDVGPGWFLLSWEPHPHELPLSTYVALISPLGVEYTLYRLSNPNSVVAGWSGDGRRFLVVTASTRSERVETVDLESGRIEDSFRMGGNDLPEFTNPNGEALLSTFETNFTNANTLVRRSLDGDIVARYPGVFPRVHRWNGSFHESPDGTEIAFGAQNGLALLDNDGSLVATLPIGVESDCYPVQWWSSTVILATCTRTLAHGYWGGNGLFEFSDSWKKPRPLTVPRGFEAGNINAWQLDNQTFVQEASYCGPPVLGVLRGHRSVRVNLPGFFGSTVVGSTDTSLAVESSGCGPVRPFVDWYTPATGSLTPVFGPPVLGGIISGAVAYPTPTDQGLYFAW